MRHALFANHRPLAAAAGALLLLGATSCVDVGLIRDVTFPATVPGVPADGTWTHLPVGPWVTAAVSARAISACLPPGCAPGAMAALLTARGEAGRALAAEAVKPNELLRALTRPSRAAPGGRARIPLDGDTQPMRAGRFSGFAIRLSRADGTRAVHGVALAETRGEETAVILVVAPDGALARQLARDVAARAS